jgi:hypothetical protein
VRPLHLSSPPAAGRSGRWERAVLGTYLLGCYLVAVSLLVIVPFETSGRTVRPDSALAGQIQIVAAVTIAVAVALAVHHFGVAHGLNMMVREAWPGLLGGAALGFITGAPLRAFVPADAFWLVLAPVYLAGIVAIRWSALRAPPDEEHRASSRRANSRHAT